MAVRCRGRLTLYEARGKFQMTVVDVEPTGAGALALAFEQLKQRLGAEGLFDPARKRPLPFLPRRIGVVTSPSGAVIRDIVRVAHRRYPIPILLAPTPVQGEGAALGIAAGDPQAGGDRRRRRHHRRARRRLAGGSVGVQRGAGRARDLRLPRSGRSRRSATRPTSRSRTSSPTCARRRRRPRPSAPCRCATTWSRSWRCCAAAAGARWPRRRAAPATSWNGRARGSAIRAACSTSGASAWTSTSSASRRVLARRLAAARADLRGVEVRLHRAHPHRRIAEQRHALAAMRHRLETAMQPALVRRRHAIEAACGKLEALSPMRVLERGFSLTQRADGHVVTSAADVQPGERITVRVQRRRHRRDRRPGNAARNDPRGGAGRGRQQEPLARDPQRRLPRAGHRRPVRRDLRRAARGSTRSSPTCARRATAT